MTNQQKTKLEKIQEILSNNKNQFPMLHDFFADYGDGFYDWDDFDRGLDYKGYVHEYIDNMCPIYYYEQKKVVELNNFDDLWAQAINEFGADGSDFYAVAVTCFYIHYQDEFHAELSQFNESYSEELGFEIEL